MLALDAEKVKETGDTATLLFSRQDSRRAARALVGWLQEKKRRLGNPWCLVPARERMVARRDGETRTSRESNRGQTGATAMEERYGAVIGGKPHPF